MSAPQERYALLGYTVAAELIRRHRAGQHRSAQELEAAISALLQPKRAGPFRRFIAENQVAFEPASGDQTDRD